MEERLQKYMARCGVDSRRKCEELIAGGRVEVNGEVVREPGVKIDPRHDRIKVDGRVLRRERLAYYIHYKVKGVTTTVSDDLGRRTIMDCLPASIKERVYPVGRLDKESEGLILLTNDGEMANYLTHPAHGVGKTYRVVAEGRIEEEVLRTLAEKGMRLGPVLIKPSRVELVRYDNDNTVVLISVSEGINREVRRIFAALGHEVGKLLRVQVGPLSLQKMKRGTTRPLTEKELTLLRKGMEGVSTPAEAEMFPPGSARSRRPTGPRGRPRPAKAPRRGKPDPAQARPRREDVVPPEKTRGKKAAPAGRPGREAPPAAKGRGGRAAPTGKPRRDAAPARGRKGPEAAKAAAKPAFKATKPLRPVKPKAAGKPASRPAAKPAARRPRPAAHPLSGRGGSRKNG